MPHLKGMTITSVVFSSDRQFLCVTVEQKIATFFKTGPLVKSVGVFNFSVPISIDFRSGTDTALAVSESGNLTAVIGLASGNPRLRKCGHFTRIRDPVISIAMRGTVVFAGLASGLIVQFDVLSHPFSIKEVKQLKNGLLSITNCPRGGFFVFDINKNGFLCSANGEWSPMPCPIKNAIMCTPISFLCRVPGEHSLQVVQMIGRFTPMPTAVSLNCPVLKTRQEMETAILTMPRTRGVCLEWGMPLALRLIQARESPKWVKEQVEVMRHVLVRVPQLVNRAARYSCLLHDCEMARGLFLRSNPEGSNFIINMLKAVIVRLGPGDENALRHAASQMLVNGMTSEAIDLLLITGNWEAAVSNLITMGMLIEAALVCRVQENSTEKTELMERLAVRMFVSDMIAYSMVVMSEIGDFDQIADRFGEAGENGQAKFLAALGWE
jgi:hypothetical protein